MAHHAPNHSACWHHTPSQRLDIIADGLAENEDIHKKLPGLRTLLKDTVNPEVPVSPAEFHQRLLRVFRQSDYDFAYEENLKKLSQDERDRVEKFVAEEKPIDDVSRDFDMCISLGVREHLQHLTGMDSAVVSSAGVRALAAVPPGGPVPGVDEHAPEETDVEGLSGRGRFDWLADRDNVFHSFLHKLKDLFTGHGAEHNVVVSVQIRTEPSSSAANHRRCTKMSCSKTGVVWLITSRSTLAFQIRSPASSVSSSMPKSTT